MQRIKKGDIVQVTSGDDKGKKGRVLEVFPDRKKALVEGINVVKKHKRRTQQDPQQQQMGLVSIELPVSLSNLMPFCKQCSRPVRAAFTILKDGSKSRICKTCKEVI
jgi:large subunit ribosomal protein L24